MDLVWCNNQYNFFKLVKTQDKSQQVFIEEDPMINLEKPNMGVITKPKVLIFQQ